MFDDHSDERLMLSYKDGNASAFDVLYGRYKGPLHRYLTHQCGNQAHAEELYQEIWIAIVNARLSYQPLAKFSTYIFRIAHNRLMDHFRKHARETAARVEGDASDAGSDLLEPTHIQHPIAPSSETPHAMFDRSCTAQRISSALADLPAPQRDAFLLAEEGGLTLGEIASTTSTSRETAKSRLRYAVAKLRHSLGDLL